MGPGTAVMVIFIAVALVAGGALSIGQIAAFVFTGILTMNAIRDVAVCGTEMRRVSGSLSRVMEILAREPEVPLDQGEQKDPVRGEIVFDRLQSLKDLNERALRNPSRPGANQEWATFGHLC